MNELIRGYSIDKSLDLIIILHIFKLKILDLMTAEIIFESSVTFNMNCLRLFYNPIN